MPGVFRQVVETNRIIDYVIQLFGRPFGGSQPEIFSIAGIASRVDNKSFRRLVNVVKRRGCARWPSFGFKIPDIEVLPCADGTLWVAQVLPSGRRVPFPGRKNSCSGTVNDTAFLAGEDV